MPAKSLRLQYSSNLTCQRQSLVSFNCIVTYLSLYVTIIWSKFQHDIREFLEPISRPKQMLVAHNALFIRFQSAEMAGRAASAFNKPETIPEPIKDGLVSHEVEDFPHALYNNHQLQGVDRDGASTLQDPNVGVVRSFSRNARRRAVIHSFHINLSAGWISNIFQKKEYEAEVLAGVRQPGERRPVNPQGPPRQRGLMQPQVAGAVQPAPAPPQHRGRRHQVVGHWRCDLSHVPSQFENWRYVCAACVVWMCIVRSVRFLCKILCRLCFVSHYRYTP